jgi:hypothetical protein
LGIPKVSVSDVHHSSTVPKGDQAFGRTYGLAAKSSIPQPSTKCVLTTCKPPGGGALFPWCSDTKGKMGYESIPIVQVFQMSKPCSEK